MLEHVGLIYYVLLGQSQHPCQPFIDLVPSICYNVHNRCLSVDQDTACASLLFEKEPVKVLPLPE